MTANIREFKDDGISDSNSYVPVVNTSLKRIVTSMMLQENSTKAKSVLKYTKKKRQGIKVSCQKGRGCWSVSVNVPDGQASILGDNHVALELRVVISVHDGIQSTTNGEVVFVLVVL